MRALFAARGKLPPTPPRPEADHTGADVADAVRRPLHALGAALQAAGGGRARAFRSLGDESRARERASIAQWVRERQAEDARRLADRRSASSDEDRAARREIEQRRADTSREMQTMRGEIAARRADIAERRADVGMQVARAQLGRIESEEAREAASLDPTSEPSRTAQSALQLALAGYPPEAVARLEGELGRVDGLNQRQAEQVLRALPAMFRDLSHRRGGRRRGGSGGGASRRAGPGTPRELWGTDDDPLIAAAVAAGIDEALARDMATRGGRGSRTPRARLEGMVTRAQVASGVRQRSRERRHRMVDYERIPGAPELSSGQIAEVRRTATADEEFVRVANRLEELMEGLTNAERAQGVAGFGGDRVREIERSLDVLRAQLRSITNAGNSLGAQMGAAHEIPGLDAETSIASLLSNVRAAVRVKHRYVGAVMRQAGYRRAGESDREPGAEPSRARGTGGRVRVRHPDGRTGSIPRDRVEAAQRAGFQVVD